MSQRIVIDSLAFAREAGTLQGSLLISELTRILDQLVDSAGCLSYRVEGRMSPLNRPQLLLHLDGTMLVCCQRCLEGMSYAVQLRRVLEFVDDEEELTLEEIEDDSTDYLPAQRELDVVALIEDEIILDLPSAPRHDFCALPEAGQGIGKFSPFSVLKGLKGEA